MADFSLSDVDIFAVSLCKGPANRKRFFLKKHDGEPEVTSPAPHRLIKEAGDDWSVVYAVVAAPDWEEQPGVGRGAVAGKTDIWESADEIRAAAHRFMKNGGLINRQHEDMLPYGRMVENFIAPVDMEIGDELIKAGSWCIGIEPTEEGRRMIDNGEWDGVSYEGDGIRSPIAKASDKAPAASYGKCDSCGAKVKRGAKTCASCGKAVSLKKEDGTMASMQSDDRNLLQKIADKLGISETDETDTLHGEDKMNDAEREQLAKVETLEAQLVDLTKEDGRLSAIETTLGEIKDRLPEPSADPEVEREELQKQMDKLEADHAELNDKLEKLGEGDSKQDRQPDDLKKKDNPEAALASALLD
jgi:hypothetical protein